MYCSTCVDDLSTLASIFLSSLAFLPLHSTLLPHFCYLCHRQCEGIGHKLCAESHGVTHDEEVGEGIGPDSPVVELALCAACPILHY